MTMTAAVRKAALTAHVTASVGWLGAVVAFLALSVAGISSAQPQVVQAAYLAMHLTTWFVIVPFCLAALMTGVVQSLGTPWGLFRHYWVVMKLVLTMLATLVLFVHTQPIDRVAAVAAETALASSDLRQVRLQLVGDAAAALFVLLITTTLSVYKPWGLTPYGIRMQSAASPSRLQRTRVGGYVLVGIAGVLLVILLVHLFGGGMHAH